MLLNLRRFSRQTQKNPARVGMASLTFNSTFRAGRLYLVTAIFRLMARRPGHRSDSGEPFRSPDSMEIRLTVKPAQTETSDSELRARVEQFKTTPAYKAMAAAREWSETAILKAITDMPATVRHRDYLHSLWDRATEILARNTFNEATESAAVMRIVLMDDVDEIFDEVAESKKILDWRNAK